MVVGTRPSDDVHMAILPNTGGHKDLIGRLLSFAIFCSSTSVGVVLRSTGRWYLPCATTCNIMERNRREPSGIVRPHVAFFPLPSFPPAIREKHTRDATAIYF